MLFCLLNSISTHLQNVAPLNYSNAHGKPLFCYVIILARVKNVFLLIELF